MRILQDLTEELKKRLRNCSNADSDTRVFCCKSAEVQERKGVVLRSGAKERAQRAKERVEGGPWRVWVVKVTTKDKVYGE